MRRSVLSVVLFLAAAGLVSLGLPLEAEAFQKPKAPLPEEFTVADWGQPKEFKKGAGARHWIWYEEGRWHYRTTGAAGDPHQLVGQIDIVGGGLAADPIGLKGEAKMKKGAKKQGKEPVLDRFKFEKTRITTAFSTAGAVDGLDFVVDAKATHLKFSLKVDGVGQPDLISVGKAGDHPKDAVFVLPAHPPEPTPGTKGKGKKN